MVGQYNGPTNTIFIMDRGYECYNSIAHIEQKGMYYIIQAKDPSSHGIAASLNNPVRRVGRGFRCSRQDFSHWDALEPRFSPELRFS